MRQNMHSNVDPYPQPFTQKNLNLSQSLKNPLKKTYHFSKIDSLIEDSELGKWQNIPEIIQKAIGTLLENQNKLVQKMETLEAKSLMQEKVIQGEINKSKSYDYVKQLEDEVTLVKEQVRLRDLENEEKMKLRFRKFVLTSEFDDKIKQVQGSMDSLSKKVKERVDQEEFIRSQEKIHAKQEELRRQVKEKVDQLDLMSQKDELEELVVKQMQKMGKMVSENSMKILRNSKDLMKKMEEKNVLRVMSTKLEVVSMIREIWKGLLPL
jgi:hypothetical protein